MSNRNSSAQHRVAQRRDSGSGSMQGPGTARNSMMVDVEAMTIISTRMRRVWHFAVIQRVSTSYGLGHKLTRFLYLACLCEVWGI